ncbi:hypothetical protein ZOSMA_68G00210 [Zostera marina]|uniref:Uncharacterized protein n=1 Tax=Zostera marina TaxID=29655 RepID=A0A0K9NRL9_ZOSMR|nr:hypothetical protein ZOSMA_68G00210 [Zostera marina]
MYDSNFCFQQMYEDLMDPSMGVASDYASNFSADPFPISSTTDYNRTSSCLLGVVNTMATTIGGHVSHDQMQPGNGIWVPSEASNQGLGFNEMMSGKCVPLEKSVNNIVKGQWTAEEDELLLFPLPFLLFFFFCLFQINKNKIDQ